MTQGGPRRGRILDGDYRLKRRGLTKIRGKGELETYYLKERKGGE